LLFREATVFQERNEHNLLRDFADEIPGYLHNGKIAKMLQELSLKPGTAAIPDNLMACYGLLQREGFVDPTEMTLLEDWLSDVGSAAK
jgi:hypothetical protein